MWLESVQSCHAVLTEIFMLFLESVRLNTWKVGTRHHEINQNIQISGIFMFIVKHNTMAMGQSQEFVSGRYKTFTPPFIFL
jgi:hypothetical protein